MELEKEIEEIKKRNIRVEKDKAWETSFTRKVCIAILTYIVVVSYTFIIKKYLQHPKKVYNDYNITTKNCRCQRLL